MKLFISVSGCLSTCVGGKLFEILKFCFQGTEPWFAEESIERGKLWRTVLSDQLTQHRAGIIVLTRSNQQKPWICFEAGAIEALSGSGNVFTMCIDFPKSDVEQGPLSGYQHTEIKKDSLIKLASDINRIMPNPLDHKALTNVTDIFVERVMSAVEQCKADCKDKEVSPVSSKREDNDMLRELLDLTREQGRQLSEVIPKLSPNAGSLGMQGLPSGATGATGVVFGPQSGIFYPTPTGPMPISVAVGSTRATSIVKHDKSASTKGDGESSSSTSARVE
jgi:hypothetical protein